MYLYKEAILVIRLTTKLVNSQELHKGSCELPYGSRELYSNGSRKLQLIIIAHVSHSLARVNYRTTSCGITLFHVYNKETLISLVSLVRLSRCLKS